MGKEGNAIYTVVYLRMAYPHIQRVGVDHKSSEKTSTWSPGLESIYPAEVRSIEVERSLEA